MGESFGEIKINMSDHKKSETSEDSFFGEILVKMEKEDQRSAHPLKEIGRSAPKKKLITDALLLNGCNWLTLSEKRQSRSNGSIGTSFGFLGYKYSGGTSKRN